MSYRLGLLGYPIQHSLSPWIHRQFLKKTQLAGDYRLFELSSEEPLSEQINRLKQHHLHGFNVTIPFKESIIPYLSDVSSAGQGIGAVNTVLNQEGQWVGYNTDAMGYLRSLESNYPNLLNDKRRPVLIIGAGGAARAIYYALLLKDLQHVDIANRTVEKANLVAQLNHKKATTTHCLTLNQAAANLEQYRVIIQTTSVGMKSNGHRLVMPLDHLQPSTLVSDIIYQPIDTPFLQEAEKRGARIHHGHTMLLYQAQTAFEIWTKRRVSIDDLDLKLQTVLEEN